MADDAILQAGAVIDTSQIIPGMQSMASETQSTAAQMTASFEEIGAASQQSAEKMNFSATEARHALHGLGEEVGVHVPRFVQSFVAHLGTVGPILAAAFTPIAVIGLVQVLSEVPDAFDKIIDKIAGFDKEMKRSFADATKEVVEFQRENVELAKAMREVELVGKEGPEKARLALEIQKKTTKDLGELLGEYQKEIRATTSEIEEHISGYRVLGSVTSPMFGLLFQQWRQQTISVDELKKHLEELRGAAAAVQKELMFRAPADAARSRADLDEAVHKHQIEVWNREVEENRKRILAELNDDEKAAREKIRIMEEEAKENREINKNIAEQEKKLDEEIVRSQNEALRIVIEARRKEVREQERLAKEAEKPWIQLGRAIAGGFDSMIRGVLQGTQTLGQAMSRLAGNMLIVVTEALAKMLLKHVAHWVAVHVLEHIGWTKQIGIAIAGATTKKAVQSAADTSAIVSDAGVAGAAGFASVMEALPFPENVAVAPGVMAESIATTLGNLGFVAARQGMLLNEDRLIAAGAGEAVLPRDLTAGLQRVIRAGGGGPAGSPSAGSHTFNISFGPVTALDARGVDAILRSRSDTLVSIIRQQQREFRL